MPRSLVAPLRGAGGFAQIFQLLVLRVDCHSMAAQPKRVLLSIWQCPFNMGLRVTLWNWTEELSLLPFGLGNFPFPFHPPPKRAVHLSTVGLLKNQCVSLGSIHGWSQTTNVERHSCRQSRSKLEGPCISSFPQCFAVTIAHYVCPCLGSSRVM